MNGENHKPWHLISAQQALLELETSPTGLSDQEAQVRLERYGANRLKSGRETSVWQVLRRQFTSPLIYILMVAMAVTLVIECWTDAIVIGAVIAINTVIGFVQENRAENAMRALIVGLFMAAGTLVVFQIFHVFNCRSEDQPLFSESPLSNKFLLVGTVLSLMLHFGAMYFSPAQLLLRLEPLTLQTWGRLTMIAISVVMVVELDKLLRRRR